MKQHSAKVFALIVIFFAALGTFAGMYTAKASAATFLAQSSNPANELKNVTKTGGPGVVATNLPFPLLVARVVSTALSFVSLIVVCVILYAGYLWWSAGGNEDKVSHAKTVMRNAAIGLIVILLTRTILNFVVESVLISPDNPSLQDVVEEAVS